MTGQFAMLMNLVVSLLALKMNCRGLYTGSYASYMGTSYHFDIYLRLQMAKVVDHFAFQGVLGKSVSVNLTQLQIVNFKPVTGLVTDLPECVVQDFSCDQRFMYNISLAVQTGHVSDNLASKNPGTLNHARWLTLANRLLRLYVSSVDPTGILLRLVSFIVNHYAPNWFLIKAHPKCTDGPKNLFHQIQLTSRLSREDREIV